MKFSLAGCGRFPIRREEKQDEDAARAAAMSGKCARLLDAGNGRGCEMPGKTEEIDLKREKRELDEFLSAIVEDEAALSEENVFTSGDVSVFSPKDQFATASDEVTAAPIAETDRIKSPEKPAEDLDPASSGDALFELEEPAATALPEEEEISVPLDSIETMARFDEPKEFAGRTALTEKRRTSGSDASSKKESNGILHWIGMTAAFVVVMTLALLARYFWVYPERGVQAIDLVKSILMGL